MQRVARHGAPQGYRVARRLMKQITVLIAHCAVAVLRRTWLVIAITVVSCAAFAARAASALVAVELARPRPAVTRPAPRAMAAALRVDNLVERNMFCSSCGPAALAEARALPGAVLIETSLGRAPSATLRVLASEAQGSWGVGEQVPGLGTLDRIASTWVEVVDAAGRRGRLSLLEGTDGPGAATPRPSAPPAVASKWADRVRQLDDNTYEVDRAVVREMVQDMTTGSVRVAPVLTAGKLSGLKLIGVRPDSAPAAFGLKSRDTLTQIDGEAITGPQQGIDLYAKLDTLDHVELAGLRDGKPLLRTLRLR